MNGEKNTYGIEFTHPTMQRFMDTLYDARTEYPFVSVHVYGNHPDLGATELSRKKDIEVALIVPDNVFKNRQEMKRIAKYVEEKRRGDSKISVWLENEGGYKDPRKLRGQNTQLLYYGQEPIDGYLGGLAGANYLLLDMKLVTGRTIRCFQPPHTQPLLESVRLPELPGTEAEDIANVAGRDVHLGIRTADYPRVAKGHIKAALAFAVFHNHGMPSIYSVRQHEQRYSNIHDMHNYHLLAVRFLTDSNNTRYSSLFNADQCSLLEVSRFIRSGLPFSDARIIFDYSDYKDYVDRFVAEVQRSVRAKNGRRIFVE